MGDTKENILRTALELFARDGYEAVSVRQIAEALGMTKGALYKHYQNKRDIFDHIIAHMERQDSEQAVAHQVPEGALSEMASAYSATAPAQLLTFSQAMFRYWTEDPFAAPFRRLLTLEQYRDEEMAALYQQYLCAGPLGYLTDLCASMGDLEPERHAVTFYAPMFFLYSLYDGQGDTPLLRRQLEVHWADMKRQLEGIAKPAL